MVHSWPSACLLVETHILHMEFLHTESRYLKPPLNILKLFSIGVVLTSHTCFRRTFSEYKKKKNTQTLLRLSITLIAFEYKTSIKGSH